MRLKRSLAEREAETGRGQAEPRIAEVLEKDLGLYRGEGTKAPECGVGKEMQEQSGTDRGRARVRDGAVAETGGERLQNVVLFTIVAKICTASI